MLKTILNEQHLYKLTKEEKKVLVVRYLGMHFFLQNCHMVEVKKNELLTQGFEQYSKHISGAMKIFKIASREEKTTKYLVVQKDLGMTFFENNEIQTTSLFEYETDVPQEIVEELIASCKKSIIDEAVEDILSRGEIVTDWNKPFENYLERMAYYRFVLGSGVSFDYGSESWGQLEQSFKNEIDSLCGITSRGEDVDSFVECIFNINYGSFEVLKDLSQERYYEIAMKSIDKIKFSNKSPTKSTTLSVVADILYKQYSKYPDLHQVVLTFNYDKMLENELERCDYDCSLRFCSTCNDVTFTLSERLPFVDMCIEHCHGILQNYYPDKYQLEIFKKTLVLSTDEYISAYKRNGYASESLFNHLNETCIFVGNSITDYEEQKVLREHIEKYPSAYHYAFFKKENNEKNNICKTLFLLKIGIIPIWFNNFGEYLHELEILRDTI